MKARDIMTQPVTSVNEETTLEEIARQLLDKHIGCVPVVDEQGKLSGIITESDFAAKERGLPFSTFHAPQVLGQWLPGDSLERIYQAARSRKAREIMNHHVVVVREDDSIEDIVSLMLRNDINRIPVVRDGVPVGIVARHDLLALLLRDNSAG